MLKKLKKPTVFFFLAAVVFNLIKFLVSLRAQIPLTIPEIEAVYLTRSLLSGVNSQIVTPFAIQNGYGLFPVQILYLAPFAQLANSLLLARLPGLVLHLALTTLTFVIVTKIQPEVAQSRFLFAFATFAILFNPWLNYLTLFYVPDSLGCALLLVALLVALHNKLKFKGLLVITFLLILASLTSLSGFLTATFFFVTLIWTTRKSISPNKMCVVLAVFLIPLLLIVKNNQSYLAKVGGQKLFISQLRPAKLADEINERQKVDFLAANKKFILPAGVRKFVYNKPVLALDKIVKQVVSLADIEQFVFPLNSYDIISKSGILPKGNFPLLYLWSLPLFLLGIWQYTNTDTSRKTNNYLLFLLLAAVATAAVFQKRYLISSMATAAPVICLFEIRGFELIVGNLKKCKLALKQVTLTAFVLVIAFGVYEQHKLLFTNSQNYQTTDLLFFTEIANAVATQKDKYAKVIVTNRFGPTYLAYAFYSRVSPQTFWKSYADRDQEKDVLKIADTEFRQINFPYEDGKNNSTLYVGLPGEFTRPSGNANEEGLPEKSVLIAEITGPDELVYHYGKNIWLITFEN